MGQKCLIFGAGGFIGMNLAPALLKHGAVVRAIGRRPLLASVDSAIEWIATSFDDTDAVAASVRWADVIFHLSGGTTPHSSIRDPVKDAECSILHTLRLLEIAREHGKPRIVFASSGGAVYGAVECLPISEDNREHPISAYGVSKLAIEKYLDVYHHLYGLPAITMRISNAYGPFQLPHRGQGLIATLLAAALAETSVEIWGDGEIVRDFIYIDDVVDAMIAAAVYDGTGRVFNVGSGTGLSVNAVADAVDALLLAPPLKRIYRPAQKTDVAVNVLDTALICEKMGWQKKVSFSQGLRRTAFWIKENALADLLED